MNVDFINPFLGAAIDVLKTMAFVEVKPGKPFVKNDERAQGDISGLIGITGPCIGSMSLTFSRSCILKIVSTMLGEDFTEINEDIKDAVGELTNMIAGVARNELGHVGLKFRASIPMVVTGPFHEIKHKCDCPIIGIPFDTDAGSFLVEVAGFKDNQE